MSTELWKIHILENLNLPQQQAVQTTKGPLLILAGAGSGKTRTIIHRIAYMIHVENIPARQIVAVTFTNKAAQEMRERLSHVAGPVGSEATVRTFHSLGLMLLRYHHDLMQYPSHFSVWDDSDQIACIMEVSKNFKHNFNKTEYRFLANTLSGFKDKLITPNTLTDLIDTDEYEFGDILPELFHLYENAKRNSLAVDFADLVSWPVRLMQENPVLKETLQNRYRHWLIDEYQDTNLAQYQLVQLVAERDKNLCVVGDDDQAIYGWRGANVENILNFSRDFTNAKIIKLEENYRSVKPVLDVANSVIRNNPERMPKTLFTQKNEGARPRLVRVFDDVREAAYIADQIKQALRSFSAKEIAVLYRTNSQSRLIEEALLNQKIPYRVYGGLSFFARKEIKDVLAYFKLLVNGSDEAALLRAINTPTRGIGDKSIEKILDARQQAENKDFLILLETQSANFLGGKAASSAEQFAAKMSKLRRKLSQKVDLGFLLDELMLELGLQKTYEEEDRLLGASRLENIAELRNSLLNYQSSTSHPSLDDYLQQISLFTSTRTDDGQTDETVSLMTVHNAKGLEFSVVMIAGFNSGYFPHFLAERDDDISEERRLFYVAVTRAKSQLFLVYAERRMSKGFYESTQISPFMAEIENGMLQEDHSAMHRRATEFSPYKKSFRQTFPQTGKALRTEKTPAFGAPVNFPKSSGEFSGGDIVEHSNFGRGRVLKTEGEGDNARIHIFFDDGKSRKFLLKFTTLKKIL